MKQLIQDFKSGELYIDDVPLPGIASGFVLVENNYSLISAGTEKSTVSVGQASLLGKAKMRPDLVKQVIGNIKKEGLLATFTKVKTKLDSLKALGYSTSGTILSSLDTKNRFKPGDRVACAGQDYASHAEIVSVPQNLVVKIPENVSDAEAAFTTVGAIALQGVRQAEVRLGDNVLVIGLGLIGQISCQLLKASGCHVFGIDVSSGMVDFSNKYSTCTAINRHDANLLSAAAAFANGNGFDSVIVTASAPTNDPILLAGELLRKKGTVVVVGAVKMDIPRDPHYYRKELEVKLSCSYGPGRYDPEYELEGHDYPYSYIRYTEQRNMEAFLGLLATNQIDIKPLITHTFDIDVATEAYDLIMGENEDFHLGVLLKYPPNTHKHETSIGLHSIPLGTNLAIGFIGAGSFAQSYLLPNIPRKNSILHTVVTRTGINAKNVAKKFDFAVCSTDPLKITANKEINTVFIATQHNTHGRYVLDCLRAGKHVFVEKPLCLTLDELDEIRSEKNQRPAQQLLVGFNRRFSELAQEAKQTFQNCGEPIVVNYRVNAGFIPRDHWTQTTAGGGRVLGEVCHFIDFAQYILGSDPIEVMAKSINSNNEAFIDSDNLSIQISFRNGSLCHILYQANGAKAMEKERVEISAAGKTFVIHDYREGLLYTGTTSKKIQKKGKGHQQEVHQFLEAVMKGQSAPISPDSIFLTTLATLKIIDSLDTGLPQLIEF